MKKTIALLLALVMVLALTACGGNGTENTDSTDGASAAQKSEEQIEATQADDEEEGEAVASSDVLFICKALLGDSIALADYEEPEVDEDSVNIYHNDWLDYNAEFDYTMTIEGTTFTLGSTIYQDMLDEGWAATANMPENAESLYRYFPSCEKDSCSFTIILVNPTESDMPIVDTILTGIGMEIKYGGSFDLSGITENSSIADVISTFGDPYHVYYGDVLGLELSYQDELGGSLEFSFDDSGVMTDVSYDFNDHNLI